MAASPSAAAAPPVAPETAPAPPPQPTPSAKAPLNLARIGSVPDAVWLAVPVAAAVLLEKTVSFVARRFLLNRYGGLDSKSDGVMAQRLDSALQRATADAPISCDRFRMQTWSPTRRA